MLVAWVRCLSVGFRPFLQHLIAMRRFPNPVVPREFHEKVLWRKIFDHAPVFTRMTDKLESRRVAKSLCSEVKFTRVVWQGTSIDSFPFETIEIPVIVKTSAGSGDHYIYDSRAQSARDGLIDHFNKLQRKRRFGSASGEWAYKNIVPKLFAESFLQDRDGMPPDDYKLYYCSGQLVQMHVTHDRWGRRVLVNYDADLRFIDVDQPGWQRNYQPRDWHLIDDVLRVGALLATDMDFVRIDLYVHDDSVYFGEFTLYPNSGLGTVPVLNDLRGDRWDIGKSLYFRSGQGSFRREYLKLLQREQKPTC